MHAIDGHELLGERIPDAVMIGRRANDPAHHFAAADAAVTARELLAEDAPPVPAHAEPQRRRVQQGRGPLDRVNLGEQGGQDQPRLLEQPVAVLVRVVDLQAIADGVVLAGEQRVQGGQADPPVAVDAGELQLGFVAVHAAIGLARQQTARREVDLAVGCRLARRRVGADARHESRCSTRRSAMRPTSGVSTLMNVGGLPSSAGPRVGSGCVRGTISGFSGNGSSSSIGNADRLDLLGRGSPAMAEPVVDHELDPGRGKDIESGRRGEGVPRQQPAADQPRIGIEQARHVGVRALQGNVAAEPRAGHAHARLAQVVVRAVRRARGTHVAVFRAGCLRLARFGVVEIEATQIGAKRDQVHHRKQKAEAMPDDAPVDDAEQITEKPFHQSGPIWLDRRDTRPPVPENQLATLPRSLFDRQGSELRPTLA